MEKETKCYTVDFWDVISNAFIECLKRDPEKRFLRYDEIERFRKTATDILKTEHNIKLNYDEYTPSLKYFQEKYDRMFVCQKYGDGCFLKKGFTKSDLIQEFRGCLPFDVLVVFCDPRCVESIFREERSVAVKTLN